MNYHDIVKRIGRADWIKPALTPLSKITDEHAIEVAAMMGYEGNRETEEGIKQLIRNGKNHTMMISHYPDSLTRNCVIQYLISKGYAVPLWFGIDHWVNGLTAIDLEIGIDKTLTQPKQK